MWVIVIVSIVAFFGAAFFWWITQPNVVSTPPAQQITTPVPSVPLTAPTPTPTTPVLPAVNALAWVEELGVWISNNLTTILVSAVVLAILLIILTTKDGRGAVASGVKKLFVWAVVLGLIFSFFTFTEPGRNIWRSFEIATSGQAPTRTITASLLKWSDGMPIRPGCKVNYDAGNGTIYKVQTRFYSAVWQDHTPGETNKASEVRFMILKPGITQIPIAIHCS